MTIMLQLHATFYSEDFRANQRLSAPASGFDLRSLTGPWLRSLYGTVTVSTYPLVSLAVGNLVQHSVLQCRLDVMRVI